MTVIFRGIALVTGASSGLGEIYADRLAKLGYDLILVARRRDRLETVARRLENETGRTIKIIVADLSKKSDLIRVENVLRTNTSITMLVNNAGIGAGAPLVNSNVEAMDEMIKVNVTALMRLCYAIVPEFIRRGEGTIINISSIVAIWPEILNGVYAGSKAFVYAFTHSLKNEVAATNIKIHLVLPGATATDFWDAAGLAIENLAAETVMRPENTVDAALAGLAQGEFVTIPSLPELSDWKVFEAARQKLIPKLSRAVPADRYLQDVGN